MTISSMKGLFPLLLLVAACTTEQQQQQQDQLQVKAAQVKVTAFNSDLLTTANVLAFEEVVLKAPINATVLGIEFKEGEKISKGQSIIHLDDRIWKAQLIGKQAQLENAEKDYQRKLTLLDVEGSTQEEVDLAKSNLENLKSEVQKLRVNIALANVKAPFSGVLGMRDFSEGAYLKEGETITTLTNLDKLRLDFAIPQSLLESINKGTVVQCLHDGDTLDATVYAITPQINTASRTVSVRAVLSQDAKHQLLPGAYIQVLVATNHVDGALMVPTQSIVPEIDNQTIFVYKDGIAVRKNVVLGNRSNDMVHVKEGIEAGDTIITTGLLKVKDGMAVTIQEVE